MNPARDSSDPIAEAAAVWLARRDRGFTAEERRGLQTWLAADPRHAAEWTELTETWQQMDDVGAVPALAAEAAELEMRTRPPVSRWPRWALSAAFAAAAVVVGFFLVDRLENSRGSEIAPAVIWVPPEARRLPLPDGSVVEMRGETEVTVDFTEGARRVHLRDGEAFFTVAHDAARPFLVEVDRITVRAVGTAFNVRRDPDRLDVVVTEGRVRVATREDAAGDAAPLIAAGAGLSVSAQAGTTEAAMETRTLTVSELDGLLAWRSPLLEFSRATLPDVLAAFARQRVHRVRLGDPVLAERTISGTFQADNIDGFLRLAEATLDLRVERRSDGEVLLLPSR